MTPSTGFADADARDDFLRARRRHALARLGRRLQRESAGAILPFDEVVEALGRTGERDLGAQVVVLDTIVGTVDRGAGSFDAAFRPATAAVRTRWERIATAMRRGEALPPVSLYRIGEAHFVRDGHHRVSVARALGRDTIDAFVIEVRTRVTPAGGLTLAALPHKTHERVFRERVPLVGDERDEVVLSDAGRYGALAESVEAWAFRATLERGRFEDRGDVAAAWLAEEFRPVVAMIHAAGLQGTGTDADAYLDVACERYRIAFTAGWSEELLARVADARRGRR